MVASPGSQTAVVAVATPTTSPSGSPGSARLHSSRAGPARPRPTTSYRAVVLEWKPPDPRLVALVRRIQDAVRARIGGRSIPPPQGGVIVDEAATEKRIDDASVEALPLGGDSDER